MALTNKQKKEINNFVTNKIEEKLKRYLRESTALPFLLRLIQDAEKVSAYSFIHSIATSLGMSIYEEVSVIIARDSAEEAFRNMDMGGILSKEQKSVIAEIVRGLRNKERMVDKKVETKLVLAASSEGGKPQKDGCIADFYMKRKGLEYYFEIKTPKPNIDVFTASKKKLLEWVARKRQPVKTILAFPYNPYHPKPYKRFTEQGLLEHNEEFLIGKEYWDFLGGEGTFDDLLKELDKVGKRFKKEIAAKIQEVAKTKVAE